jgi:hypothetical protein
MPTQCNRDLFGYEAVEGREVSLPLTAGRSPRTPAGCCLARPIGRSVWSRASPTASRTVGSRRRLNTGARRWSPSGVFGIALGYEDLVDHDQLPHDPVLATLAGKLTAGRKTCAPLAGKSTLNRLEHAPWGAGGYHKIGHDGAAIEGLMVEPRR